MAVADARWRVISVTCGSRDCPVVTPLCGSSLLGPPRDRQEAGSTARGLLTPRWLTSQWSCSVRQLCPVAREARNRIGSRKSKRRLRAASPTGKGAARFLLQSCIDRAVKGLKVVPDMVR